MQHLHPVSSNEPKSSILLFSLLSFSFQGKEGSLAHKFAGGKEKIVVWARRRSSKDLPYREANDRKTKLPKFGQSLFKIFELSSSNDPALYGKPVRGGTNSWLVAPLLCFESAQQLKRAASSRDKVSCRKQRRQQAADVPHSALAARVPAPTSSLEA